MRYWIFLLFLIFFPAKTYSQGFIRGRVVDEISGDVLPGATITVKGTSNGMYSNLEGVFLFKTSRPSVQILVSHLGYTTQELEVDMGANILIKLKRAYLAGDEVVVAASRTPERILEAPVSIERMGLAAIQSGTSHTFYDALPNLKGVESSVQSLNFRSISTRGFNANGNFRLNQFVDGVDNQTPGLQFSVGNVTGIPDIDLESAELLPGSASALYGGGGTNGTLLMTSKDPFKYQGFSMSVKTGLNHIDQKQFERSDYEEFSLRFAKALTPKFAFKIALSGMQGRDWEANDYSNYDRTSGVGKTGNRSSDHQYDGVNIYGDEPNAAFPTLLATAQLIQAQTRAGILSASGNLIDIVSRLNAALPANASNAQMAAFVAALPVGIRPATERLMPVYFALRNNEVPNNTVSRTGYAERDLVDYKSESIKTLGALHYRISNKAELIAQASWGTGKSIYTGPGRIPLDGVSIGRYKLELKGDNFFVRTYTTRENSGDSYYASLLGIFINEYSVPATTWFPDYVSAYASSRRAGQPDHIANQSARTFADRNRLQPGTASFNTLKSDITNRTIGAAGGVKFHDKSNLVGTEGMYHFKEVADRLIDIQIGLSTRTFNLRSNGTLFDDLNRRINIREYAGFVQTSGKVFADRLKLTAGLRFDKSENFEGRITPRFAMVYTPIVDQALRASYQTGFRNPTNQNQYTDLLVGPTRLIGGLPELIAKYDLVSIPGYTQESVNKFLATGLVTDLKQYSFSKLRPESVQAYEFGYKGLYKRTILIDASIYHNRYKNFISQLTLLQPTVSASANNPLGSPRTTSTSVNSKRVVIAKGAALGFDYVARKYNITASASYNELVSKETASQAEFNTPKLHLNVGISTSELATNLGMGINYRWQSRFQWYSTFVNSDIPAFGTVDAQMNYKLTNYQTIVKIGASNVLNRYYRTSGGNPSIGGLYYISLLFDQAIFKRNNQ